MFHNKLFIFSHQFPENLMKYLDQLFNALTAEQGTLLKKVGGFPKVFPGFHPQCAGQRRLTENFFIMNQSTNEINK